MDFLASLPRSVDKIDLALSRFVFRMRFLPRTSGWISFPRLKHLHLVQWPACADDEAQALELLPTEAVLDTLYLGLSPEQGASPILRLLASPGVAKLRQLTIFNWNTFFSDEVVTLMTRLSHLESLDVSGSRITGVGVKTLINALPKLKVLRLLRCSQISADAVEWARCWAAGTGGKVVYENLPV